MTHFFRGKRIWIIGCSEGIGRALAQSMAEQGSLLALSSRNGVSLNKLASSLDGDGHLVLPCDVCEEESVNDAFRQLISAWGNFDILIYNAGIYDTMPTHKFDLAVILSMLNCNVSGALRVLKNVLPLFIAKNSGHIAIVGSLAGYRGLRNAIGYGMSKSALIHLAENLALDLHDTNIKVQIINPGFVRTRLTDKNDFKMPQLMSTDCAAQFMMKGLQTSRFEIRFPWFFSTLMKILRLLPYRLYFKLASG